MDFQTLKEKISTAVQNIKSKFSKDSSNVSTSEKSEDNINTNEDGMMSIDDYFAQTPSESTSSRPEKKENGALKKGLDAAKSFIGETNYNPFADQEETRKIDKKEFKDNWFKIFIKILIAFIMIFLAVLLAIIIYKFGYDLLHDTDISSMGGYSDFLVPEGNLSPTINENDLIIVQKLEFYEEGDIILYEFAGTSHKIGKVADIVRGYYIVTDNNIKEDDYNSKISEDLVVGKTVKVISNFKGFYNFITSPIAVVLLVVVIASYFYLISKGKVKDNKGIV